MADSKKVIDGLKHCDFGSDACYEKECPYHQSHDCIDELKNDILALLKEQDNCENCAIAIEDRQSVVRCKDCKHAEHCEIYAGWDGQHLDWFCADGERETTR